MAQLPHFILLKLFFIISITITSMSGKRFQTTNLGAKNRFIPTKVDVEGTKNQPEYEVYNYTQIIDNFNYKPESYTTFQQRYVVIRKHWGGPTINSPIFVYTGAESSIMGDVEYNGFELVLASRFKGLLIYIEHRYYGTSMPFGTKEEEYKNANTFGYFSSEQALADYARLIVDVKKNMSVEN